MIRFDVSGEKGVTFLGRYERAGDRLRQYYPGPVDDERGPQPPAGFASPAGSTVTLGTWVRARE